MVNYYQEMVFFNGVVVSVFFNGTSTVASCLQVLLLAIFNGANSVAYLIRCSINCLSIYLQRYYQDLYVSKAEKSGILKPF